MNSEYIVSGEVIEKTDSYFLQGDVPFTDFKFKVNKVYKGDIGKEIIVTQDGNDEMMFKGYPLMEKDGQYVLFLRKSLEGKLVMNGGPHGKFELNKNQLSGISNNYKSLSGIIIDEELNEIK